MLYDGKTTMTYCIVWLWVVRIGFYAKDIAILNRPMVKVYNGNLRQRHLQKTYGHFWVFQKGRGERNTNHEINPEVGKHKAPLEI